MHHLLLHFCSTPYNSSQSVRSFSYVQIFVIHVWNNCSSSWPYTLLGDICIMSLDKHTNQMAGAIIFLKPLVKTDAIQTLNLYFGQMLSIKTNWEYCTNKNITMLRSLSLILPTLFFHKHKLISPTNEDLLQKK